MCQIIREKLYSRLYREVPYILKFERTAFRLTKVGEVLIKFNILVPDKHVRMSPELLSLPMLTYCS